MKIKIYYDTRTQYENNGDLLISLTLINELKHYGNVIFDDNGAPPWYTREIVSPGTEGLSLHTKNTTIKHLFLESISLRRANPKSVRYLFLVPGHVTSAAGTLVTLKRAAALMILKIFGVRIVRVGFSIDIKPGALIDRLLLKSHYYLGLRDKQSLHNAIEAKAKNADYFPDLAWLYHPPPRLIEQKKKQIIISFRSSSLGTSHDSDRLKDTLKALSELLQSEEFKHYKITIAHQVSYDKEACQEIASFLKKENTINVEHIDKKLSLTDSVELYSQSEYVISNRLHVLLIAAACKAVPVPLIKDGENIKIQSIFEDNQLDNLIIHESDNPTLKREKYQHLHKNRSQILKLLDSVQKENTEKARHNIAKLFN